LAEKERQSYDLEALKAVPIDSIAKVNSNNFFQTNPFRTEKEPSNSLFYYRKDNRAQDFGSGKSYDAIDVFMAVNNCSFVEACKGLQSLC
jgi:DNA primase